MRMNRGRTMPLLIPESLQSLGDTPTAWFGNRCGHNETYPEQGTNPLVPMFPSCKNLRVFANNGYGNRSIAGKINTLQVTFDRRYDSKMRTYIGMTAIPDPVDENNMWAIAAMQDIDYMNVTDQERELDRKRREELATQEVLSTFEQNVNTWIKNSCPTQWANDLFDTYLAQSRQFYLDTMYNIFRDADQNLGKKIKAYPNPRDIVNSIGGYMRSSNGVTLTWRRKADPLVPYPDYDSDDEAQKSWDYFVERETRDIFLDDINKLLDLSQTLSNEEKMSELTIPSYEYIPDETQEEAEEEELFYVPPTPLADDDHQDVVPMTLDVCTPDPADTEQEQAQSDKKKVVIKWRSKTPSQRITDIGEPSPKKLVIEWRKK